MRAYSIKMDRIAMVNIPRMKGEVEKSCRISCKFEHKSTYFLCAIMCIPNSLLDFTFTFCDSGVYNIPISNL